MRPFSGCTIIQRQSALKRANGFDGLRLLLALGIVVFHSFTITSRTSALPPFFAATAWLILPAFFALSGYLVTASAARCKSLSEFLLLRGMRLLPALTIVVLVSALVFGPLLSNLPVSEYFSSRLVPDYLKNILAAPQYHLPGLFEGNPRAGVVNGSLWTISIEITCYALLCVAALLSRGRTMTIGILCFLVIMLFPRIPFVGLAFAWIPAKELVLSFFCGALINRLSHVIPFHTMIGVACMIASLTLAFYQSPMVAFPLAYVVVFIGLRSIPLWITSADYSYGIYLVGYPLQQMNLHLSPLATSWWGNLLLSGPLAVIAAIAIWHCIERPVLSRKKMIVDLFCFNCFASSKTGQSFSLQSRGSDEEIIHNGKQASSYCVTYNL